MSGPTAEWSFYGHIQTIELDLNLVRNRNSILPIRDTSASHHTVREQFAPNAFVTSNMVGQNTSACAHDGYTKARLDPWYLLVTHVNASTCFVCRTIPVIAPRPSWPYFSVTLNASRLAFRRE